ncbi:MAG: ABC transporter ATP-binding protein [Candidatus Hadarchaeum sp.]
MTKKFIGVTALSKVSIDIKENKIFGLIGPNGSGKTTLLNVINGFLKPEEGQVKIKGKNTIGLKPHEIARMGVGRTFQFPRVFSKLSVESNILVSNPSLENTKKLNELLQMFDLMAVKNRLASDLGYGQKKMLELARAMATDAWILLLDEPLGGLDSKSIEKMLNCIKDINEQYGKVILVVEHNLDQLFSIADYVYVLHGGKKVEEGTPREIKSSKILHDVYFRGF